MIYFTALLNLGATSTGMLLVLGATTTALLLDLGATTTAMLLDLGATTTVVLLKVNSKHVGIQFQLPFTSQTFLEMQGQAD